MPNSTFAIFRNRNFTRMWIAQLISEMGASVITLASSLYIYQITGSALNVGLLLMATVAPSPLIGLIAGVFVDRMDRKRILLVADLLQAGCSFAIPCGVLHFRGAGDCRARGRRKISGVGSVACRGFLRGDRRPDRTPAHRQRRRGRTCDADPGSGARPSRDGRRPSVEPHLHPPDD